MSNIVSIDTPLTARQMAERAGTAHSRVVTASIRFPKGRHARLKRLAGRSERSMNWLVNDAVEKYLKAAQ